MGNQLDTAEAELAEVAARQHGVISTRQLEAVGVSKRAAAGRVRSGRLHRIHRGVFAVGHGGLSPHGRFMAAVLACGGGAVLSHVSAAVLWNLLRPIDGPVHVSVPCTSGRARRPGIHLHRCPSLQAHTEPSSSPSYPMQEGGRGGRLLTTYRDDIPVTTVPRTIGDLRASSLLPPHLLRRAIRQAELAGYRLDGIASDRTRSDLEAAFLDLYRRHELPEPGVNVKLGRWKVDFLWRAHRLVVEADTWTYHRGSTAFEDDHARDLDLRAAGYMVLRFTDKQLEDEPERIADDLRRALKLPALAV
jgi:very-short-patch-repair endonuclease